MDHEDIAKVLSKICKQEKITATEENISSLSRRVGGDVRAAINDLQSLTYDKKGIGKGRDEYEDAETAFGVVEDAVNDLDNILIKIKTPDLDRGVDDARDEITSAEDELNSAENNLDRLDNYIKNMKDECDA